MSMNRRSKPHAILALLALMTGAGCSSLPTGPSPEVASESGAGPAAAAAPAAAIRTVTSVESVTATKMIYGTLGGRVTAGNFTVVLPPLAVAGTASVRITQPDVTKPYVHLEISPSSANKFRVPVLLIATAGPIRNEKLALAYIAWLNPATGKYERVLTSEVNLVNRTVIAPLRHFSEYAVEVDGKAGW